MIPLTNRFEYLPMSRVEVDGHRTYQTPCGQLLSSVTTILDSTKPLDSKQSLDNWRKRVGDKKAQTISEESSSRGTRMHKYLENWVLGKPDPRPTNPMAIPSWLMHNEIIEHGLSNVSEFWGIETALYYSELYAGTTDGVGVWKNRPAIIDYKQSNKVKKREWIDDYFIQEVFYGTAHNKMFGTKIETGVIMMCVQPDTLQSKPQYLEFVIEGSDWRLYEQKMWDRIAQFYKV